MLRLNRSRLLGMFCLAVFIYFIAFTDSGASTSEFRANTEAGLLRKSQREQGLPLRGHLSDEDLTRKTNDELQGILSSQSQERKSKDRDENTAGRVKNEPAYNGRTIADLQKEDSSREEPRRHNEQSDTQKLAHDVEQVAVAGRKIIEKPKYPKPQDEKALKADAEDDETESGGDPGKDFAREKLMEYLKNPVVIFSKSYCPHSKRAKHLLLDVYKIVPKPLVVELDMLGEKIPSSLQSSQSKEHDDHNKLSLGKALQDLLAEITSRRTVPNIVVGGHQSIGGNDKIWGMHESGTLAEEIRKFGGRKVISVDVNDPDDSKGE